MQAHVAHLYDIWPLRSSCYMLLFLHDGPMPFNGRDVKRRNRLQLTSDVFFQKREQRESGQ